MPEKSVREMGLFEKQHHSLEARTFRATIIGAIVFGLAAMLLGMGMYTYAVAKRYLSDAYNLTRHARVVLENVVDPVGLVNEIMDRYYSLSEEERKDPESEAYQAVFADIEEREDYQQIISVFATLLSASDVYDLYLARYDVQTSAIIYMADPEQDPEYLCKPGFWEEAEQSSIKKYSEWDGVEMISDVYYAGKYGWLGTSGVQVKDASGEVVAFIMADVSLANLVDRMKAFVLQYAIMMFVVVNIVAIVMTLHMKKTIVKPVTAITEAAKEYVKDRQEGNASGSTFADLHIKTGDELENLALTMADMERELTEFEDNLTKVTAEKERVGTELSLATRIQADMLPNIFPAFPDRPDFDVYAFMRPAKEVGGDFYDFFLIDEDHLALVIADVSGKGVPAALFMMVSKILVQNYTQTLMSPKAVLEMVNNQICKNNREEMFVTVWLGVLDLTNGKLTAANAGHEYPVLMKPGGHFEVVKDRHGFIIGGMEGSRYKEYELQLDPGAELFVYTDGVPEANNDKLEQFGMDRMLEALRSVENGTPEEVLKTVDGALQAFVGEAPQFDDVTMLAVKYIGKKAEKMKEMTVEATVDNIAAVTDFVNEELEELDCPMKAQMQIDVAIDELFGNIAQYAYDPETGPATVRVEVEDDPLAVIVTFIDNGKPFDPLAADDPDITQSAEDRKIGGLGVFLVKKTMDDVSYEYKDGQNILRIKKNM